MLNKGPPPNNIYLSHKRVEDVYENLLLCDLSDDDCWKISHEMRT